MTQTEARAIVQTLRGWDRVRIVGGDYGPDDYVIDATDPSTGRRLRYDPTTGFFRS